jgi:hypothetical protein
MSAGMQTPTVPTSAHDWHSPEQSVAQHTPSKQWPLAQSPPALHTSPLAATRSAVASTGAAPSPCPPAPLAGRSTIAPSVAALVPPVPPASGPIGGEVPHDRPDAARARASDSPAAHRPAI